MAKLKLEKGIAKREQDKIKKLKEEYKELKKNKPTKLADLVIRIEKLEDILGL